MSSELESPENKLFQFGKAETFNNILFRITHSHYFIVNETSILLGFTERNRSLWWSDVGNVFIHSTISLDSLQYTFRK